MSEDDEWLNLMMTQEDSPLKKGQRKNIGGGEMNAK